MATAQLKFGLRFAIMCLLLWGTCAQRNTQRKEELIQDTVRKFLGVKSDERTAVPGKAQSLPPRYMMDLYEKYRSGQTPMQGNTVRSILAMKDKIDRVDMLIFNLTSLKSTEHILQSKLYLLKRRKPKGGKKKEQATFRLNIGCLPGMASSHQIDISLGRQKPEWHSYDISESVVSCRQSRKSGDSLLGLTLEIKRPKGSYRLVAFKRLVKPSSQPFVLIFSEDSQNQTASTSASKTQDVYGEIGDLLRVKANAEGVLPEKFRIPHTPDPNHRHRKRRSTDENAYPILQGVDLKHGSDFASHFTDLMLNSENYVRKYLNVVVDSYDFSKNSRSEFIKLLRVFIDNIRYSLNVNRQFHHVHQTKVHSNKIFQRKDISNKTAHHPNLTNDEMFEKVLNSKPVQISAEKSDSRQNEIQALPSQKRIRRSISDTLRYSTEAKESNSSDPTMNTIQVIDENYIKRQTSDLFPKSRRRNRKKKLNQSPRRHKKKRRRNRKLPFWWTRHDSRLHAQDVKQLCKRKSLVVDFSQLGWDDWIISPKSFNAHYCEGSCTFPIIKHTETSNHAAVQSLIHAMGLNTNIPTPSCVPSTTSSLTLLYFDEHGGLVLKSYPHMIVEKCGCR